MQTFEGPSFATLLCWRETFAWLIAFTGVVAMMSALLYADSGIHHRKLMETTRSERSLSPEAFSLAGDQAEQGQNEDDDSVRTPKSSFGADARL